MSPRNFVILLLLSLIWGASFLFIKVAVATIPPLCVAFGRTSLAAVLLYLVLRTRGLRMPGRSPVWGTFLLMGFFNGAVPYTLITWAEIHIDSGLAAILNALMPLFTVLLAHLFTGDERLNWLKVVGIFLGFCGVLALIGPAALKGLGKDVLAQLAVMAAALCYAIAIIYGRRLKEITPPGSGHRPTLLCCFSDPTNDSGLRCSLDAVAVIYLGCGVDLPLPSGYGSGLSPLLLSAAAHRFHQSQPGNLSDSHNRSLLGCFVVGRETPLERFSGTGFDPCRNCRSE